MLPPPYLLLLTTERLLRYLKKGYGYPCYLRRWAVAYARGARRLLLSLLHPWLDWIPRLANARVAYACLALPRHRNGGLEGLLERELPATLSG